MRYVSIDIETTGLDPVRDQILQIGAVVGNTDAMGMQAGDGRRETFLKYVAHDRIVGHPKALAMNAAIVDVIAKGGGTESVDVADQFAAWLVGLGFPTKVLGGLRLEPITVAGKSVAGFDVPFLRAQMPKLCELVPMRYRVLDVGTLYLRGDDLVIPDLAECKRRAGVEGPVVHDGLADALDVVLCVEAYFQKLVVR